MVFIRGSWLVDEMTERDVPDSDLLYMIKLKDREGLLTLEIDVVDDFVVFLVPNLQQKPLVIKLGVQSI